MKKTPIITFAVTALLALAACSGGGGGDESKGEASDGAFSSGVSQTRKLSSLSVSEKTEICDAARNFSNLSDLGQELCTISTVVLLDSLETNFGSDFTEQDCKDGVASCESDPAAITCSLTGADLSGCTATVGDYEDCLNAVTESVSDVVDVFSCAEAAQPGQSSAIAAAQNKVQVVPECEALKVTCPAAVIGASERRL